MTYPKTLFKYKIWEKDYNKKILTHNEVYLPSADQLNDPFDMALPFNYKQELTIENIRAKLIQVAIRNFPNQSQTERDKWVKMRIDSGELTSPEYYKKFNDDYKKSVNDTFGIYSLTPYPDNLLMWSHYSNSHTGFCVGFDTEQLITSINSYIYKAIYSTEFHKLELFDENPQDMIDLLRTKSKHWEYEQEWRIIKNPGSRVTVTIPPTAITSVILGNRMKPEYKNEILQICKDRLNHATILNAVIDDKEFKLNLV